MNQQNPNVTTLQTGLGRASRRTGNRIDRLQERTWWLRQQVTFPLGMVPCAISFARTYYTRALILGGLYLLAHHGITPPYAVISLVTLYVVWELVLGGYLFTCTPKFDLAVRVFISLTALVLVHEQLFQGVCYAL